MSFTIVCYKLMSGEEILGRVSPANTQGSVTLSHVRVVTLVQKPEGVGVMLLPFCVSGEKDGEVEIAAQGIIGAPLRINTQLEKLYTQDTTSIQMINTTGIVK